MQQNEIHIIGGMLLEFAKHIDTQVKSVEDRLPRDMFRANKFPTGSSMYVPAMTGMYAIVKRMRQLGVLLLDGAQEMTEGQRSELHQWLADHIGSTTISVPADTVQGGQ